MYKFNNSVKNLRFSMSDNSRRFALLYAIMKFVVLVDISLVFAY